MMLFEPSFATCLFRSIVAFPAAMLLKVSVFVPSLHDTFVAALANVFVIYIIGGAFPLTVNAVEPQDAVFSVLDVQ